MANSYSRYKSGRCLAVASLWPMFILCASGAAAQIWCHPWMSASNSAVLPIQTSDRWKEKPHGNPTFFFRKSSFTGNIVLACPRRSHCYRGGGCMLCVRVSYCGTLNGLLRLHSQGYRPLLLTAHVQESSYCCLLYGVNMFFLTVLRAMMSTKVNVGFFFFLISNTFYYTVKYKTITKRFYSQMYKI